MAESMWGHRSPSLPRPAFPAETPFDAARIAHDALDTASAVQHFQLANMSFWKKTPAASKKVVEAMVQKQKRKIFVMRFLTRPVIPKDF
jgi:hypothetical protein